jgi:methionine-rich copper-binding protein CopC
MEQPGRPLRLLGVLGVLAVGLVFVGVGVVYAHADYARSEPGAGAVVAEAPARVDVWFTQDMFRRQGENWLHVAGPDGAEATAGEAVIDDDDRRHLWVELLPNLPAGEYTVTWHTLSAEDGDDEEGTFTFTVDPEAQVTSTPMLPDEAALPSPTAPTGQITQAPEPTAAPAPSSGCGQGLLPVAGLVVAGLGLGWRRRR